ncbi:MAG: ribose-phosphate diphosphokinase [Burkholderiaceae bacterium]|nr:ribose-phosphate diphosphokinase [Burkholderiaceae bacterium]
MLSATTPGCVLAFDDEREMADALARTLDVPLALIERHRFPDGELKLRLPATLPPCVVLLRSLHQPNEKLVELLITAPAARELGAQRLLLACPYLAYMRQDIAFLPGEAVSQRHIGSLLASRFDVVVTVDPHLHRISALSDVMPGCRAVSRSAAALIGAWVARHVSQPLLLGPDEESAQWVSEAARACSPSADHGWCVKQRHGDRDVVVTLPPALNCRDRAVVLIDDMASTGRTLMAAAKLALAAGALSVDVAVTHALFVGDALDELKATGVRHVWSTDCVPHASNAISVVPLLADALRAG